VLVSEKVVDECIWFMYRGWFWLIVFVWCGGWCVGGGVGRLVLWWDGGEVCKEEYWCVLLV